MMKKAWILGAFAALLFAGCYVTPGVDVRVPGPPGLYPFEYYPGPQVYFDPVRRLHFYMEGGVWISAPVLPPTIIVRGMTPVRVELDTPEPYRRHDDIRKRYPPGIQKKFDHGGRDGDDDKWKGKERGRDRD